MAIVRLPRADEDAWEIWSYIDAHHRAAADRFLDIVDEKLSLLERHPQLGPSREELAVDLRSFVVRPYLLFYRPIDDGIELIRVLHGARDLRDIDFG